MRSPALMNNRATEKMITAAVKPTVYRYFCAGEDVEEAGLKGKLDYGQEDAEDDEACDWNLAEFLNTVATTSSLPSSSKLSVIRLRGRRRGMLRCFDLTKEVAMPFKLSPIICHLVRRWRLWAATTRRFEIFVAELASIVAEAVIGGDTSKDLQCSTG